ncbi:MAG TPA: peptide-methionine (S)-S-oxide reductase MsrA [Burkholderiaceae bacterium]|nr:peptide-methionine (S)-S-oxide reductase MsrA [Burkholderiaceae bacterium]
MNRQFATLGGGCFWCLEAVYRRVQGVLSVESGYAGGHVRNPTYEQVCAGNTGHAEVVRIEFDADSIGYRELLEIFFAIHDPTTPNQQGNDTGPQYRSAIFYEDDAQQREAQQLIDALERQKIWRHPIVTEVVPLSNYSAAEAYHQRYFENHPNQGYCMMVVGPKVAKYRRQFANRLREPLP